MPLTREQRIENLAKARAAKTAKKAAAEEPEISQQSQAVRARWAQEHSSEEELEKYFDLIDVEEGLNLLARMRKNCDLAARTINKRISSEEVRAKCAYCGGPRKVNKQWYLIKPRRDPVTQLILNDYFCDIFCVAMQNKKEQGIAVVSDKGVIKNDKGESVSVIGSK